MPETAIVPYFKKNIFLFLNGIYRLVFGQAPQVEPLGQNTTDYYYSILNSQLSISLEQAQQAYRTLLLTAKKSFLLGFIIFFKASDCLAYRIACLGCL